MKIFKNFKLLVFVSFLMFSLTQAFSQNPIVGQSYVTAVRATVTALSSEGKPTSFEVVPGIKFTVISINNNLYRIQFGNFSYDNKIAINQRGVPLKKGVLLSDTSIHNYQPVKVNSLKKADLNISDTTYAFIGQWANYKTFFITPKELDEKCIIYYTKDGSFTFGALTLPLKIRFGNGNNNYSSYEENLNLGLTAGYKLRIPSIRNQNINFIGLFGVASVNVDSLSLKNKTLYSSTNPSSKALSFGLGIVYQNDTFQVGVLTGIDHISGILGRSWYNQDRLWLGIGIGLSLYNSNSTKTGTDVKNNP